VVQRERVINPDISVSGTMAAKSRLKQYHHALLKTRHCLIYPRGRREIVSFANRQHAMARVDGIFVCITASRSVQNSIFPFLDKALQCGGRMYEFTPHYRRYLVNMFTVVTSPFRRNKTTWHPSSSGYTLSFQSRTSMTAKISSEPQFASS